MVTLRKSNNVTGKPISHRCHKKEFLLKFVSDRKRMLMRLFPGLTKGFDV